MLWFKRPPDTKPPGAATRDVIVPVPLVIDLDSRIFVQKFAVLLELIGGAGGVDVFLETLATKSQLFQTVLDPEKIPQLALEGVEMLLETVMPARKRLWPALAKMDPERLRATIGALLYGDGDLEVRFAVFVDAISEDPADDPRAAKRRKRAGRDFAAETLHFLDPKRYPLMTSWVWDQGTHTGAMRELVKGGDSLSSVPLGSSPGVYEAGRAWLTEQMAAQGVYREPHYVVDLFLAHAYADYMRAMSSGMGLMNADFGGKADPLEAVKKLLGIDETRKGQSRIRKTMEH